MNQQPNSSCNLRNLSNGSSNRTRLLQQFNNSVNFNNLSEMENNSNANFLESGRLVTGSPSDNGSSNDANASNLSPGSNNNIPIGNSLRRSPLSITQVTQRSPTGHISRTIDPRRVSFAGATTNSTINNWLGGSSGQTLWRAGGRGTASLSPDVLSQADSGGLLASRESALLVAPPSSLTATSSAINASTVNRLSGATSVANSGQFLVHFSPPPSYLSSTQPQPVLNQIPTTNGNQSNNAASSSSLIFNPTNQQNNRPTPTQLTASKYNQPALNQSNRSADSVFSGIPNTSSAFSFPTTAKTTFNIAANLPPSNPIRLASSSIPRLCLKRSTRPLQQRLAISPHISRWKQTIN